MRTKEERKRCKKGHETTIGKVIYGFLLFLPLLAIGVTCGYAMFNKNAYQSYASSGKFENSLTFNQALSDINTTTSTYIVNNNTFYSYDNSLIQNSYKTNNFKTTSAVNGRYVLNIQNLKIGKNSYPNAKTIMLTIGYPEWRIYAYDTLFNNTTMYISNNDNGQIYTQDGIALQRSVDNRYNNLTQKFEFDIIEPHCYITSNSQSRNNTAFNTLITTIYQTDFKLSSIFYDSVDKVTQSNLFNWSQNSIIYTGMSNFTTALSITNTFIPTLLTYWLIISIVYFMYDIVLMMLTILHRKIHDLQDSL